MELKLRRVVIGIKVVLILSVVIGCDGQISDGKSLNEGSDVGTVGRMIEEGRTLVHHAVKRFMIILPAIFFKLGIGFTLLILVTIVAVNNGFIGFLLLVVGLSSVLARLQEARRPLPYIQPLPPYHHFIDRSDQFGVSRVGHGVQQPSYQYENYGMKRQ